MKKRIIAIVLSALLAVGLMPTALAADGIASVSGNLSISVSTEAAEGTPVLLVVLPAIIGEVDGEDVDVTEETVLEIDSVDDLLDLGAEHVAATKVEDGKIEYNCVMSDDLPTGLTYVFGNYMGSEGTFLLGTFEHVGAVDIDDLMEKINAAEADEYYAIIDEDTNGSDEITEPVKVLEKSSADLEYYFALSAKEKEDFAEIVYEYKPEENFDLLFFVDAFNEAGAWVRLYTEDDTFDVLETYNGKYWEIEIDEESDFDTLSRDEKKIVLDAVKKAKYIYAEDLQPDFEELVVMGLFRMAATREDIEDLIDADGKYAAYFEGVREIIDEADLSKYKIGELYNAVLKKSSSCDDIKDVEKLFEESIPGDDDKKSSSGSSVNATGGYKGKVDAELTDEQAEKLSTRVPFTDVEKGHWAEGYIEKLYNDGVINGIDKTTFAPSNAILRQDFVKILVGALGLEKVEDASVFTDVAEDAYYKPYVMTAYANDLISGISKTEFGTKSSISRQDAAVIIARVLEMKGIATKGDSAFADEDEISDYAKEAIEIVAAAGIFGGDDMGRFNPKASLSRAETCAILFRLTDEIKEG